MKFNKYISFKSNNGIALLYNTRINYKKSCPRARIYWRMLDFGLTSLVNKFYCLIIIVDAVTSREYVIGFFFKVLYKRYRKFLIRIT